MQRKWYLSLTLSAAIAAILVTLYSPDTFDRFFVSSPERQAVREEDVLQTVARIKANVKIGSSKQEVASLFGDRYVLVDDQGDLENGCEEFWLYRFFTEEDYQPSVPDHVIDEEGIRSGKVGAAFFIGWKDERVYLYTIAYLQGPNHDLHFYSNVNGTIEDEIMNPDGTTTRSE
ncbi:hypothetical protein [Brevibacillus thermoruber]|uniref:hypothetical protein n=1 Tax=Brevibacillus thermoruber TaxID=33942 RepID=UPI000557FBCB|nr:hypothetical protein [Brevibacillus thermoruber]